MLLALLSKQPGVKLHVVTDNELVYLGSQGKCGKWKQQGWVGSKGPLAHVDLWSELWERWLLLGDSVSIQWVLSRVGKNPNPNQKNERADEGAIGGSAHAFKDVLRDREVWDIWNKLGLEEMDDPVMKI